MMIDLRTKYGQRVLWEDETYDVRRVGTLFQNFLLALASLLVSIRRVVGEGDGAAARILGRTYLELWELLIAVVADRATFVGYAHWLQDPREATAHWRRTVSPARVRGIVSAFWNSVDPALYLELRDFGSDAYARWSGTVHGNPIALFTAAYARAGRTNRPALGGRFGPDVEAVADDICWFTFQHLSALWILLGRQHDWSVPNNIRPRDAAEAKSAWLHFKVLQSLHIVRRGKRRAGRPVPSPPEQRP
jgi:hypothetical protein